MKSINGWKIYELTSNRSLYARHAYVDRRWTNQGAWHVRVYAVLVGDAIFGRGKLYCMLQKTSLDQQISAHVTVDAYVYERSMKEIRLNNKIVHRVMITCRVPELTYYTKVLVTSAVSCTVPKDVELLDIKTIESSSPDSRVIGVCVPLAYGHFDDVDAVRLVEWIEINRMFGVSEINIYNVTMTVTEKYGAVLDYYVEQKVVRLHHIPPPLQTWPQSDTYNISKFADLVVLNECMMDNMYRYSYVIVIDFDDVMVPRAKPNSTYEQVLASALVYGQTSRRIASYLIRDALFYLDLQEHESSSVQVPDYLSTLRHTIRIGNGQQLSNPKQVTNPRLCVHLYIHYCDQVFTSDDVDKPAYNLAYVSAQQMLVHHYRKSCRAKWRAGVRHEDRVATSRCRHVRKSLRHNNNGRGLADTFMLRYAQRLVERVGPVLARFNLLAVMTSHDRRQLRASAKRPLHFLLPHYQKQIAANAV